VVRIAHGAAGHVGDTLEPGGPAGVGDAGDRVALTLVVDADVDGAAAGERPLDVGPAQRVALGDRERRGELLAGARRVA
jgi:hypothetical protein